MSLVGFRAQNHRQQVGKRGADRKVDDRSTRWEDFNPLHERFRFTIDAAASSDNAKLPWKEVINGAGLIVMLLPANRTEQGWWQDSVEPFRDGRGHGYLRVEFLPGRMRFDVPGGYDDPRGNRPPFGCCLLIWERA